MIATYPSNLPFENLRAGFKVPKLGQALMKSPMQSGKVRMRPQFTLRITQMDVSYYFTPLELGVFLTFVNDTLGQGSAEFSMPVWIMAKYAYEPRIVQIRDGVEGVSIEPFADDQALVAFTLDVRNM